ncbi:MAG TPA: hypothetical protein P5211_09820, partial [Anaerolineae bacterium]|nr:hypothetical protein [Anaerolineae bacterium]
YCGLIALLDRPVDGAVPRLGCSGGSPAGATAEAALAGHLAAEHSDANGNPDTTPPVNSDVNAAADRDFCRNLSPSDPAV